MSADPKDKGLSPEDAHLIERLAEQYAPPPMAPARRVVFDRALAERLAARPRNALFRPVAAVASACAIVFTWLTLLQQDTHRLDEGRSREVAGVRESVTPVEEENLLTYAYYSRDFAEDDTGEENDGFLFDEYEAFDNAVADPDA